LTSTFGGGLRGRIGYNKIFIGFTIKKKKVNQLSGERFSTAE